MLHRQVAGAGNLKSHMIQQASGGERDKDRVRRTTACQVFDGSPEPTVGIEVELPILDRESGELSHGSPRLLRACRDEGIDGVSAELMQSMIEVQTSTCATVTEARDMFLPRIRRVRNIATSMGYDFALLGTHPSARATEHVLYPDERYALGEKRLAWMIYHRVTFGLHVHIGVRSGDDAIALINLLVQYLPHVLAMSANSPFWQGIDTGLASARAALYGLVPHAGIPRLFSNWKEFRNYCQIMNDCKVLRSHRDVKWDLRPRADFGTIEFRICDVPGTMAQVFGIAALLRCLVIFAQRLLDSKPQLRASDVRRQWIAVENKWLATRFGLEAVYISAPAGRRRSLRQEVADLFDKLMPIAHEHGDEQALAALQPIPEYQTGSNHQRRIYREEGSWQAITSTLTRQFADELNQHHHSVVKQHRGV